MRSLRVLVRLPAMILEQALQLAGHFLHAGRRHDLHAHGWRGDFDLDLAFIQIASRSRLRIFWRVLDCPAEL